MTVVNLQVKLPGGPEGRGEMIAMHLEDILRRYGWAEVRVISVREAPDGEQMKMKGDKHGEKYPGDGAGRHH